MIKIFILLFSLVSFAQIPMNEKGRQFEGVTGISLGRYKLTKGDERFCRGGTLHVVELENRFTLALGESPLVYSLGIEEIVFEEDKCRTTDRSTYEKDVVKQHSEINCEGEPIKIVDVLVQKTKKGIKYTRKLTMNGEVTSEVCELSRQ